MSPSEFVSVPPKIIHVIAPTFSWQVVYVDPQRRRALHPSPLASLYPTPRTIPDREVSLRPFPTCPSLFICLSLSSSSFSLPEERKSLPYFCTRDLHRHSVLPFCIFTSIWYVQRLLLPNSRIVYFFTSANGRDNNQILHLVLYAQNTRRSVSFSSPGKR